MNQKRKNRSNQEKSKKNGKIIRCSLLSRPVFENDDCSKFIKNIDSNDSSNCKNCKHSF